MNTWKKGDENEDSVFDSNNLMFDVGYIWL
jgi:hypothetical protein